VLEFHGRVAFPLAQLDLHEFVESVVRDVTEDLRIFTGFLEQRTHERLALVHL
jgi:hypothetical protein